MSLEERRGAYIDELAVGQTASFSKTVTEADIVLFAGISGDTNPVHLDEQYAGQTVFRGRIAHGLLSASLISTVLGTKLPGPGCIYLNQTLAFKAPVRIGDTVTARVTVKDIFPDKNRVVLETICHVGNKAVLDGEATVMVPARAEAAD
ncbi:MULTISPECIES: MaoC family dehydratase [Oceanibaculum]|uniref:Acyl dehydratase n=2 Tax=Oceanibaculum indicum TaxID=526216 RepID=K2J2S6_9PROT|nr:MULTISPECIES: MaoC family dehydratase [Oceanibaculum]EKE69403.1 Acyl dehydratase [Oceanibaculum indicum P24]MCH2396314.1 MaoC family dehydratase [Oceanibaculum sp.]RKQ69929.1 3-hydroxybutyryl-CoA dehydratase [Oceanibaculum indicum]